MEQNNSVTNKTIQYILNKIQTSEKPVYLIGIAGVPGSGKTTFSQLLQSTISDSIAIPMDGYHLYRKQLTEEGMKRRGAPFTFDSKRFKQDLKDLKQNHQGNFPSFDHAKKDPVENDYHITKQHKIVIVEGLYLFLQSFECENLFDLKINIECDEQLVKQRLTKRHVEAGIAQDEQQAIDHIENSDLLNLRQIIQQSDLSNTILITTQQNDDTFQIVQS